MREEYINIYQTEPQLIGCHQKEVLLPTLQRESISCGFAPYIPCTHLHPSSTTLALCPSQWHTPSHRSHHHIPCFPQVPEDLPLHCYLTTPVAIPLPGNIFISLKLSRVSSMCSWTTSNILVTAWGCVSLHEKISLNPFPLDSKWFPLTLSSHLWRFNASAVPSVVFEIGKLV